MQEDSVLVILGEDPLPGELWNSPLEGPETSGASWDISEELVP